MGHSELARRGGNLQFPAVAFFGVRLVLSLSAAADAAEGRSASRIPVATLRANGTRRRFEQHSHQAVNRFQIRHPKERTAGDKQSPVAFFQQDPHIPCPITSLLCYTEGMPKDALNSAVGLNDGNREAAAPQIDAPTPDEAEPAVSKEPKTPEWPQLLKTASMEAVKERFATETAGILSKHGLGEECCLAILEPQDGIDSTDLDQIFSGLTALNPKRDRNVLLFLLSRGGAGEPAYQISKLCKSFSKWKFKVIVPRFAKSAATLIAIGADEIHMGPLGQLGPIDPQIDGLPALGVSRALRTIASVAAQYPRSADMFAAYLRMALTVEQIGYCDRISESAVQYAERLLSTKPTLVLKAAAIAKELVHEYKDHSFVIDFDEAQKHLGSEWILTDIKELEAAEELYDLFEEVNFLYGLAHTKRILLVGAAAQPGSVIILNKRE